MVREEHRKFEKKEIIKQGILEKGFQCFEAKVSLFSSAKGAKYPTIYTFGDMEEGKQVMLIMPNYIGSIRDRYFDLVDNRGILCKNFQAEPEAHDLSYNDFITNFSSVGYEDLLKGNSPHLIALVDGIDEISLKLFTKYEDVTKQVMQRARDNLDDEYGLKAFKSTIEMLQNNLSPAPKNPYDELLEDFEYWNAKKGFDKESYHFLSNVFLVASEASSKEDGVPDHLKDSLVYTAIKTLPTSDVIEKTAYEITGAKGDLNLMAKQIESRLDWATKGMLNQHINEARKALFKGIEGVELY